jgi:hypothetical protein
VTNVTVSPAASPPTCLKTPARSVTGSSTTFDAQGLSSEGSNIVELAVEDGDVDLLVLPRVDARVLVPRRVRAPAPSTPWRTAFAMAGATIAYGLVDVQPRPPVLRVRAARSTPNFSAGTNENLRAVARHRAAVSDPGPGRRRARFPTRAPPALPVGCSHWTRCISASVVPLTI